MVIPKEKCDEWSDLEIIRKSLEEVDYFSCLYERYESRLLRYIQNLTRLPVSEAEDILQEAFIKIWKNLHGFDQSLKFSSWIYRIVHNQAVSYLRKKKSYGKDRQVKLEEAYSVSSDEPCVCLQIDDVTDKDGLLQAVLGQLPLPYQEILILKFLEGMSYSEISDVLKLPEGTVGTRINRAKKAFATITTEKHLVFD